MEIIEKISCSKAFADFMQVNQENISEEDLNRVVQGLIYYRDQYKKIVGDDQDTLSATATFYAGIDEAMKQMREEDKAQISCKKGCSYCCHINVDISMDEAKLIVEHCVEKSIPIYVERLKAQLGMNNDKRRNLGENTACAFLDVEQGTCNVYEYRPAACRKYIVFSDPLLCDAKENPGATVTQFINQKAELITAGIMNNSAFGPMAELVLETLKNRGDNA